MSHERELLRLLGPLYEAATDASLWEAFLVPCCRALSGVSATLAMIDSQKSWSLGVTTGMDARAIREFAEYYAQRNVIVEAAVASGMFRTGQLLIGDELLARAEFEASEYFNDYLAPLDFQYILGGTIYQSESRFGVISVQKPKRAGSVTPDEAALLKALLPHLRRAQEIQRHVAGLTLRNDLLTSAVDHLAAGVVLFDARARPVHVNRAAGAILASRDGLSLGREELEAASHETTDLLRRLITGASKTGDGTGQGAGGVLRVARPSGKRAYQVIVTPLPSRQLLLGRRTAAAAIFITDPEHRIEATAEALQSLFGLTRAESALCLRLVNGLNMEEAAEELGITRSTARSHLAKIFAKTETTRQAQLVGLLVRAAALIVREGGERVQT